MVPANGVPPKEEAVAVDGVVSQVGGSGAIHLDLPSPVIHQDIVAYGFGAVLVLGIDAMILVLVSAILRYEISIGFGIGGGYPPGQTLPTVVVYDQIDEFG